MGDIVCDNRCIHQTSPSLNIKHLANLLVGAYILMMHINKNTSCFCRKNDVRLLHDCQGVGYTFVFWQLYLRVGVDGENDSQIAIGDIFFILTYTKPHSYA